MNTFNVVVIFGLAFLHHAAGADQCACATMNMDVRLLPGASSPIYPLGTGQCVPYTGRSQSSGGYTWYKVIYNGRDAWARSPNSIISKPWLIIGPSKNIGPCSSTFVSAGCPRIIPRSEWRADAPSSSIGNMPQTPKYIFIHHGVSASCTTQSQCSAIVKSYQKDHMGPQKRYGDIGYNFVVGEDGNVYEGRGWKKIGAHTGPDYNDKGIAIAFIGDFRNRIPNNRAVLAAQQLIRCAANTGQVTSTYTLKGHRDVRNTESPGNALYNLIKTWPHFVAGDRLYIG